ncbi:hypothetical protein H8E52_05255 [bacterium]|nr:hypothetical protein [bacterium]
MTILITIMASTAHAQIDNGDFEDGLGLWVPLADDYYLADRRSGGNPGYHAYMQSHPIWPGSATWHQTFDCGEEDPTGVSLCFITFDYYLHNLGDYSETAMFTVEVDHELVYSSPLGAQWIDWTTISLEVPCGRHLIVFKHSTSSGGNSWAAGFDNVSAECLDSTAADTSDWGRVKILY